MPLHQQWKAKQGKCGLNKADSFYEKRYKDRGAQCCLFLSLCWWTSQRQDLRRVRTTSKRVKAESGLLAQTQHLQGCGIPKAAPKSAERAGQCLCKVILKHFWKAVESLGRIPATEERQISDLSSKKERKDDLGNLRAVKSHFASWDNHGMHSLGAHPLLREREGDWDCQHHWPQVNQVWDSQLPCVIKCLWTRGGHEI